MIWLIALLVSLQATPAPDVSLTIHYPNAREASRCVNRLGDQRRVAVTMRCRVTNFGHAVDCEPQAPADFNPKQLAAAQCMARAMRFTDAQGHLPENSTGSVQFSMTLVQDQ